MSDYLKTKDLSVGYDGHILIHDIDINIRRGEIVALIGPNGSGKSTILKTLSRRLSHISGTIFLPDGELTHLPRKALAQKMSVVLTDRIKPELMTCRDIVSTGRYPYTGHFGRLSEEDEEKISAAMAAVNIPDLAQRDYDAISDGQKQRVLLARALCQEPEIIVLDEPTSFLDIYYKLELFSILRKLSRECKLTVILSLHEIELAQKIADRVLCVKGDTIFAFGTPEEIFTQKNICALYGLPENSFDPCFGSIEPQIPNGTPDTLVLCGGGTGLPVFRRLQRGGVPFIAAVLHRNDIDYHAAKSIASSIISEEPFCAISDSAYHAALKAIDACSTVYATDFPIGEINARMPELIEYAKKQGKLKCMAEDTAKRC